MYPLFITIVYVCVCLPTVYVCVCLQANAGLEENLAEEKEERVRETRKLRGRLEQRERELNTEREEARRMAEVKHQHHGCSQGFKGAGA